MQTLTQYGLNAAIERAVTRDSTFLVTGSAQSVQRRSFVKLKLATAILLTGSLLWVGLSDAANAARLGRRRSSGLNYSRSIQTRQSNPSGSETLAYVAGVGTGVWLGSWHSNRWWRDHTPDTYVWSQQPAVSASQQPVVTQACLPQTYLDTRTGNYVQGTTCSTTEELLALAGQQQLVASQITVSMPPASLQGYFQIQQNSVVVSSSRGLGTAFDWLSDRL